MTRQLNPWRRRARLHLRARDGKWKADELPGLVSSARNSAIYHVSCMSAASCVAVGSIGNSTTPDDSPANAAVAEFWDGSNWSEATLATPASTTGRARNAHTAYVVWHCVSDSTPPGLRIGAVFPQTELGHDTGAVRVWGQEVERAGYRHVLLYDHVLGADPAVHAPWDRPYDVRTTFREPFVLFGYLAALTSLELVTGVIILPQRQTALVAKQAAEVDLLTGGRFRLGVGIGWNQVEYEALGKDFGSRGRRSEEQIALLRRLFTQQSVTFEGADEQVVGAGISPLPVQRPIPIWMGGSSPRAYQRIGRLADGWFPQVAPGPALDEARGIVEQAARDAGRDPAGIGLEGRVNYVGDLDAALASIESWRAVGATHVTINTMGAGLSGVDGHLAALRDVADSLTTRP